MKTNPIQPEWDFLIDNSNLTFLIFYILYSQNKPLLPSCV